MTWILWTGGQQNKNIWRCLHLHYSYRVWGSSHLLIYQGRSPQSPVMLTKVLLSHTFTHCWHWVVWLTDFTTTGSPFPHTPSSMSCKDTLTRRTEPLSNLSHKICVMFTPQHLTSKHSLCLRVCERDPLQKPQTPAMCEEGHVHSTPPFHKLSPSSLTN